MGRKRLNIFAAKLSIWALIISVFSLFAAFTSSPDGLLYTRLYEHLFKTPSTSRAAAHIVSALPEWPYENSDLLPDPSVVFGRLPNGFRYALMENHTPKDRVSIHLNIHAGSLHESDNQQGMAHFLEHMLFNGSKNFKPGELVKYFQNIGMQFGPDANAYTGFAYTVYMILLPKGNRENLEKGLTVMKDFAEGALLLQSEIDRERGVVLSEKRTRDSASYRTFVSTMNFEFPEAKVSKRLPIGIESVIKKADRNSFKKFYDTWYRPEKITLTMVGDFDVDLSASLIKEKFSTLSSRAPPEPDPSIGKIQHKGIKTFYHFEKEAGNTTTTIEVINKVKKEADSTALQKKLLLTDLAKKIVQNRLNALISKPDTPFTSASVDYGTFLQEIESAEISGDSNPENWRKSLSLLEQTLRRALQYGFTPSEFERVKKDFLANLDNAVNTASTRNSKSLAGSIRHTLNNNQVFLSPEQKKTLLAPLIESATLKQVHDAFREIWAPNHSLVLVTGNAELHRDASTPEDQILAAYKKSNRIAVSKPVETQTVTFPYLPEPFQKGKIKNRTTIHDLGVVQVDFKNGVRLNIKKTDFKAGEIQFRLSFGHGRSNEPEALPGLAVLSRKVINESGLGALDKNEIKRALAGKKTTVHFGVAGSYFFLKGTSVPKELSLLFQLLYAHLTDPGFREDAYKLSMERFRQNYQELSRTVDGAVKLNGQRFLAGGDSRFGLPPYESFKKLTLDQVRSWINASSKHDELEITVVGDFDIESVVEIASKYLGSLPRRQPVQSKNRPGLPEFPVGQSTKIKLETKIPKGLVIVAYPTEDIWDIQRTRRFSVLAEVLSDRLREKIREKLGAAYSAFAFNRASRDYSGYGVLQARAYVDPEQTDMVIKEIKNIVSDLSTNGVNNEELKRALEPTLTSLKDMMRTNSYWLDTVLSESIKYPQQLDWSRTIMKDHASITADELSTLAKKYLDNDKAALIVIVPE
jgi:zinc protease